MTITGYVITPYNVDTGTQLGSINVPGSATFYDVPGLVQGTTYKFLIYAQNSAGNGTVATSDIIVLGGGGGGGGGQQPPPASVPGPPTGLTGTVGIGNIAISWVPPVTDGGSPITGYTVSYGLPQQTENILNVGIVSNTILGALKDSVSYNVKVAAVNAVGAGPYSETHSFSTNSQVITYNLVSWPTFDNVDQTFTVNSAKVPTQFNGLTALSRDLTVATLYDTPNELFSAHDEIGKITFRSVKRKKNPSTPSLGITYYYDPPANTVVSTALQNLTTNVLHAGLGTINPYPDAGFVQDMLKFSARPGDILDVYRKYKSFTSDPALFLTDKGKKGNVEWHTDTESLISGWAYEYTQTRPFLRFDTRDLTDKNVVTNAFLSFKKDPNCPIVNPEGLTLMFVKANDTINDTKLISSDYNNIEGTVLASIKLSDTSLQNGDMITLGITDTSFIKPFGFTKIIVVSGLDGSSLPSDWTQITLQEVKLSLSLDVSSVTTPGAVSFVNPTASNGAVTIEWGAPVIDGGSAITSYTITNKNTGDSKQPQAVAGQGSYTAVWDSLTNGTTYSFSISASNVKGTGQGTVFSATPSKTATLPGQVRDYYLFPETSGVIVSWYPPLDTGTSAITGYQITNQTDSTSVTALATDTFKEITGLTNGTTYTFEIVAINTTGPGPSTVGTVTPTSGVTVPARPFISSVYATEGKATVFWSPNANDGGDLVIGWLVALDAPGVPHYATAFFTISDPTVLEYTISGIATGNTYTLSVAATNSTGTGPFAVSEPFTVSSSITTRGLFVPVNYNYQKFYEAPIDLNINSATYLQYLYPQNDEFYSEFTPAYVQSDPSLVYPVSVSSSFSTLYIRVTSPFTAPADYAINLMTNSGNAITGTTGLSIRPPDSWTPENTVTQFNLLCKLNSIPLEATTLAGQRVSVNTTGNLIGNGVTISLATELVQVNSANQTVFGNEPFIANGYTSHPVTNHVPTPEYDAIHQKGLVDSRVWTTVRNFDASRSSLYFNSFDSVHGNNYTIDLVGNLRPNGVTLQYFDGNNNVVTLRDYLGDGRLLYRNKSNLGPGEPITFTYPADFNTHLDPSDGVNGFGNINYDTGEITNLIFPTFTTTNGVLYPTFKPSIVIGRDVVWPIFVRQNSSLFLDINTVTYEIPIPKNDPVTNPSYKLLDMVELLNGLDVFRLAGLQAGTTGNQLFIQNIGIDKNTNLRINIGPNYTLALSPNDSQYIDIAGNNKSCNHLLFGMSPNQQPPTKIYFTYSYTNNDPSLYRYIWYTTPHFVLKSAGGPTQFITKGHLNYLLDKLILFRPAVSTLSSIEFATSFDDKTGIKDVVEVFHGTCTFPFIQVTNRPQVPTNLSGVFVDVKVINPDTQEDILYASYQYS